MTRPRLSLRWGRWLTTWATFRKRLPSLGVAATLLLAAATDANVIAIVPDRWHFLLRYVVAGCTLALLGTRSVATGSHGEDYTSGLLADRRGTGERAPVPIPVTPPAPHGVADAGTHTDDGEPL